MGLDEYLTPDELKVFEQSTIRRIEASGAVDIHPPSADWYEPGELRLFKGEIGIELPEGLTPPRVQLVLSQSEIDKREAWFDKGAAFEKSGRLEEALFAYDKALVTDLDYAAAWCRRGNVLSKLNKLNKLDKLDAVGRFREAIRAFDKATRINPKFADAWNDRGVAYGRRGDYLSAGFCYEKALQIDPTHALAAANRINAIEEEDRREQFHRKCREDQIKDYQRSREYQETLRKSPQADPKAGPK